MFYILRENRQNDPLQVPYLQNSINKTAPYIQNERFALTN